MNLSTSGPLLKDQSIKYQTETESEMKLINWVKYGKGRLRRCNHN